MKRLKAILLVAVMSLCSIAAMAQHGEVTYSNTRFETEGRELTVRSADYHAEQLVSGKLAQLGAVVSTSFFAKIFLPGVTLAYKKDIDNYTTAYLIEVKRGGVKIHYTSLAMLELALKDFDTLFELQSGSRHIRGARILYHSGLSAKTVLVNKSEEGVLDGVSSLIDPKKFAAAIAQEVKNGNKEVMVALVNSSVFRVQFSVFEGINPEMPTICEDGGYTTEQLLGMIEAARSGGGEFIPALDLLSENSPFEKYTGHEMTTAEGMRFVRAMLEECATEWGVNKVCVGTQANNAAPQGYVDFLHDIASRNNLELIIL